jgi:hypothetical protein
VVAEEFGGGKGGSPLTATPPPPANKKLNRVERDPRLDVHKVRLPELQQKTNLYGYFFVLYALRVDHYLSSYMFYSLLCISFPSCNERPIPKP